MVFPAPLRIFRRCLAAALLVANAFAADRELGRAFVRAFTRADHQAHQHFWAPFQSAEGLMYFGNQLAVLEYDGRTWRVLRHPIAFTRAMTPAPNGDIYIGDEEQLGFIAKPDSGPARFTSLLERVPTEARPFGLVRDARAWRGGIYFATDKNILRWQDGAFKVWPFTGDYRNRLFLAGERLILHRQGEGLYEFEGENVSRLSTAPEFALPGGSFVVADGTSDLLVAWGEHGVFRVARDGSLKAWANEAAAILQRTSVFTGLRLRGGELAIGTTTEGVVILSPDGTLLRHLTRANGLPHNTAFSLGEDREGGLWVGTNNGPARILWRSPATVFEHGTSGISDARLSDMVRHGDTLFYLSTDGLYRLVPSSAPGTPARFERDPRVGLQASFVSLLSHPGGLLLAGGNGLQRLGPKGLELLASPTDGAQGLSASISQPSRVFFTHAAGVATGTFDATGSWSDEGAIPGIDVDCTEAVEDAAGTLWVGTASRGVFRVTRAAGSLDWRNAHAALLTPADGLPAGHGSIYVQGTSLGVLFDTAQGIFRYDETAQRFVAFNALTAFDSRQVVLNPIAAGAAGEIWTNGILMTKEIPYPLLRLRSQPDGSISASFPPREIQDFFAPLAPYRIYYDASASTAGVVWAKSDAGLLRVDLASYAAPAPLPAPLIRRIAAEGHELVFPRDTPGRLQLKFAREPMTIAFASGLMLGPARERFQTRLVGFNDEWSPPTAHPEIAFTNLEGGPFRFEVRTLDRQGRPGPVSGFSFRVTPPWPRSPWAYGGYALLALGALTGFIRWRLARSERERRRLEALVAKRTVELDAANKAKSLFLANMSHELRTPLNGVIGYAQVLQKSAAVSGADRDRLRIIQSSGDHLLQMINEVLDFSKIEAGKLELQPAPFHLPQLLRDVAAGLEPRATEKGLTFSLELAPNLPEYVTGDAQKLRQVLDNLLSNAVKFTAEGRVELHVSPADGDRVHPAAGVRGEGAASPAMIRFAIRDTGVGIAPADREKLFQPFQQAADGRPPEPGTGLGLAICQRIVALMGGEIAVESTRGRGTTFSFALNLATAESHTATTAPDAAITGYAGDRRRVLVVDDIAVNRSLLIDLLRPLGFEVHAAADGATALAMAADLRPHLVFLDLRMPGMSGFELAAKLRDAFTPAERPKLIAMSASVLSFHRADAVAAGCDDFLPKPFHERELLERLERHLGVAWLRETPPSSVDASEAASTVETPVLEQLLATARRGEINRLREQFAALARTHPQFAAEAERLLKAYRLDELRHMLERRLQTARSL